MRLAIASLLILASSPAAAIEIANFKSGLVCSSPKSARVADGWICHETQDILVTDQSRCVYDGATKRCTWFGFEFDYTANEIGTKLQCQVETSHPTSPGNPSKVLAKDVTSQSHEFELEGANGHFFNPMYYVFAVTTPDRAKQAETFTCKTGNKVLFQAKFNLHFPEAAE